MAKQRILVIEEDPTLLRGISWILRDSGYDVVALSAADDLASIVERRSPDLILLDLDARAHDNQRLVAQIRSDKRWMDIPLITAGSDPEMLEGGVSRSDKYLRGSAANVAGPVSTDFLPKPLRVADLVARVQTQLRMRTVLRNAFDSLRSTERELIRARDEAQSRREVLDILQEIHATDTTEHIFSVLVRRLTTVLSSSDALVLIAKPGDFMGHVAASRGAVPVPHGPTAIDRFPIAAAALAEGQMLVLQDAPIWMGSQMSGSALAAPFSTDDGVRGVLLMRRSGEEPPFNQEHAELAGAVVSATASALQQARAIERAKADNARLEALAHTDPLTRVLNRRALTDRLAAELERASRYTSIVSLLMVDLDYFKALNDTYGHVAGDAALRWVAQTLQNAVRSVDMVARYGGEEFAVVLPETTTEGAFSFADRIRERIEAGRPSGAGSHIKLTVSIDVATFPTPGAQTVDEMIALADEALYRAKNAGRNTVRT
jgi:two-component system cell cycle response regulator